MEPRIQLRLYSEVILAGGTGGICIPTAGSKPEASEANRAHPPCGGGSSVVDGGRVLHNGSNLRRLSGRVVCSGIVTRGCVLFTPSIFFLFIHPVDEGLICPPFGGGHSRSQQPSYIRSVAGPNLPSHAWSVGGTRTTRGPWVSPSLLLAEHGRGAPGFRSCDLCDVWITLQGAIVCAEDEGGGGRLPPPMSGGNGRVHRRIRLVTGGTNPPNPWWGSRPRGDVTIVDHTLRTYGKHRDGPRCVGLVPRLCHHVNSSLCESRGMGYVFRGRP